MSIDPISTIIEAVMPTINKLIPDPQAQAQAKIDMQTALNSVDLANLNASKEVMVADATQDDKYTKRARPTLVYWALSMTTFIAGAALFGKAQVMVDALSQVPTDMWQLMTVGVGVFGASRGVEKGIALAVKGKK